MHDSSSLGASLSRRRFLSLSGQSALILGATAITGQLIPVTLLADEALPALPAGLLQMGRDIYPHDRLNDLHYAKPLADLVGKQPGLVGDGLKALQARAREHHGKAFEAIDSSSFASCNRSRSASAGNGDILYFAVHRCCSTAVDEMENVPISAAQPRTVRANPSRNTCMRLAPSGVSST